MVKGNFSKQASFCSWKLVLIASRELAGQIVKIISQIEIKKQKFCRFVKNEFNNWF